MSALTGTGDDSRTNLMLSFSAASLLLIVGVLASWVYLKRSAEPLVLPAVDFTAVVAEARAPEVADDTATLLEQAEIAYAAGRIFEPEYDNALYYYRAVLSKAPSDEAALVGVTRVYTYLMSQAESAIFHNDWTTARNLAAVVQSIRPNDEEAQALTRRITKFERVDTMTSRAMAQLSAGKLVDPAGDNAADTYRAILAVDPGNSAAQHGLRSVAQRLIANAQSAVFAGETEEAERFIAAARAVDPNAPGIATVEESARDWNRIVEDRSIQRDLLAAAEALQADRLMPPTSNNAYTLFSGVLERSPDTDAAARGLELVRTALVDRAWTQMRAGDLTAARATIDTARTAEAAQTALEPILTELEYRQRLADARRGVFHHIYGIGDLEVTRQAAPEYPRSAVRDGITGWVELEFTVTEDGDVTDAEVSDSTGEVFHDAAISAINRWRFRPYEYAGRPIPVRVALRFTFQL